MAVAPLDTRLTQVGATRDAAFYLPLTRGGASRVASAAGLRCGEAWPLECVLWRLRCWQGAPCMAHAPSLPSEMERTHPKADPLTAPIAPPKMTSVR